MARFKVAIWATAVLVVAVLGLTAAIGYPVFTKARQDPLAKADAIVVLGGEHDGREQYGVQLAEQGFARTVVLSDPYSSPDPVMDSLCGKKTESYEVLCEDPSPSTTRGEALFTERLATERGWKSVIVISWQYHLPRARYIFANCFQGSTIMRAVPRSYDFGPAEWELVYLYQSVATVKAAVQGGCE